MKKIDNARAQNSRKYSKYQKMKFRGKSSEN